MLNEKQKNRKQKHKPKTVLKMIEVGSSLVLVFENRQLYQFFPFIFIIIIVSHVKYAHWIKDL